MVNSVYWAWLWASSSGQFSWTLTVGLPDRTVVAQTGLSKVSSRGGNTASAFISQVCTRASEDQIQCAIDPDPMSADSVGTYTNADRITFEVRVDGMFAYATALVFVF